MLAAALLLAVTTGAPPLLTDRDRDIVQLVANMEFDETGAGDDPDDHSFIKPWTISVSDAAIRRFDNPKNDVLPVDVKVFVHRAEYAAMLARASSRFDVGRIRDVHVSTTTRPLLHCDPNGGPATDVAGYEQLIEVSAPGYARDGLSAMIYVHAYDCYSEAITLYRVVREQGRWQIADEWPLFSQGE